MNKKERKFKEANKGQLIFYLCAIAFPVVQVLIFYFYVNVRSFILGFQSYNPTTGAYSFAGLSNFMEFFRLLSSTKYLRSSVSNSLILFIFELILGAFPAILFSYYIYKRRVGSGFFKIIIYMPHIVSTTVFVLMYKYFMENAMPTVLNLITGLEYEGLLTDYAHIDRGRILVFLFQIYISFGTKILLYSGAMSSISESIIESGKIEGITPMKELIFIVVPMIWPTFVTFMIVSLTGIFTNQMSLYTFYGSGAPHELYTFGYYLFRNTQMAKEVDYPYLSAVGLLMTIVAVPLTLISRYLLNKFGPKTE